MRRSFGTRFECLRWSDEAASRVWGRRIPHVLLLHVGAFDAVMIEALLDAYEEAGVEWVALDEALEDPVYDDLPTAPGQTRGTLIDMMVDMPAAFRFRRGPDTLGP